MVFNVLKILITSTYLKSGFNSGKHTLGRK